VYYVTVTVEWEITTNIYVTCNIVFAGIALAQRYEIKNSYCRMQR